MASPTAPARAVFIDKDGTLVQNVPYNADPALVRFTPQAFAGLRLLAARGYELYIVTNQPGVALGYFDEAALDALWQALSREAREHGVTLHGFYACAHAPDAGCDCRKPGDGLLRRAAREHAIDLDSSWMVGDILDDIEAGQRAGCRTVLLDVGHETVWQLSDLRHPHHRAAHLLEAARIIAEETARERS